MQEISIFSTADGDINDYNNSCSICLENMNIDTCHTLRECSHTFHNNCIIEWLRTGNVGCPVCRGQREGNERNFHNSKPNILRLLIAYAKRKDADKKVIRMVTKYQTYKKKATEIQKQLKLFKKVHKQIFKEKDTLYSRLWTVRRGLRKITNELYDIPIRPIIIKKKK